MPQRIGIGNPYVALAAVTESVSRNDRNTLAVKKLVAEFVA